MKRNFQKFSFTNKKNHEFLPYFPQKYHFAKKKTVLAGNKTIVK